MSVRHGPLALLVPPKYLKCSSHDVKIVNYNHTQAQVTSLQGTKIHDRNYLKLKRKKKTGPTVSQPLVKILLVVFRNIN